MNIDGIAFDLDGTLLDSSLRHYQVLFNLLIKFNISTSKINLDDYNHFKNNGKTTLEYLLYKGYPAYLSDEWKNHIEDKDYLSLDKLYKDTIPNLDKLVNYYPLYLVTARRNPDRTIKQVQELGLYNYFKDIKIVFPGSDAGLLKAEAIKDNNISIVVGDTEVDLKCAELISAKFLALNRGFRSKNWWDNSKTLSYPDLNIIIDLILNKGGGT